MSTSTDAILVFGVQLAEDAELPEYDNSIDIDTSSELYRAFHGYLDRHKGTIEIVSHCSNEYPMYIVGIRTSKLRASRGSPLQVETLAVGPDWVELVAGFVERHQLKTVRDRMVARVGLELIKKRKAS